MSDDRHRTALNDAQVREIEAIAELQTRRYFDHYLSVVWPEQQKALREHTHLMVEQHDDSDTAHGAVEAKMNRAIWMVAGAAMAGSGGAVGLAKLLGSL